MKTNNQLIINLSQKKSTMKTKILLILAIGVFTYKAGSSQSNMFPMVEIPLSELNEDDTLFIYRITNNEGAPATFFPKVANLPDGEYVTLDREHLNDWIAMSITSTDTLIAQLQALNRVKLLTKEGGRFLNRLGMFNHAYSPQVQAKKFSMGFFSNYHQQCGDYAMFSEFLLLPTSLVDSSDITQISLPDHQLASLAEMVYDVDPGTPVFMTEDTAGPNGFTDIETILANPSILEEQYTGDNVVSIADYQSFFYDQELYQTYYEFEPPVITGEWTLCSGCSIELEIELHQQFWIDTTIPENQALLIDSYALYEQFVITGNPAYWNLLIMNISNALGTTPEETTSAFFNGWMIRYAGDYAPFSEILKTQYNDNVPILKLTIPAGIHSDMHFPNIVTKVITEGFVALTDTILVGNFEFELWNDDTVVNEPANSEVNYATYVLVNSPAGETVIELAYNPGFYPFILQDILIDELGESDNLTVEEILQGSETIVTSVRTQNHQVIASVYPNPLRLSDAFTVQADEKTIRDYALYDMSSKEISQISSPGIYFVKFQYDNQFYIEKLIVQ